MSRPNARAVSLLERARASRDPLAARLLLAAAVTHVGEAVGVHPIVTGGTAVDFYVAGALGTSEGWPAAWSASHDVDVVALAASGGKEARRLLFQALEADLGLRPIYGGVMRAVEVPDFPFGLEIVGERLTHDPDGARVVTVRIEGQDRVLMRGPEDVVLAYTEGAAATKHRADWTRALAVFRAQKDIIDVGYLRSAATRLGLAEAIETVIAGRPMEP